MTKIRTLAAAAGLAILGTLGAASAAQAGWYDALGYYHPTCYVDWYGYSHCY
jgi:hypothetical protein